jgi:hypothetical protein
MAVTTKKIKVVIREFKRSPSVKIKMTVTTNITGVPPALPGWQ